MRPRLALTVALLVVSLALLALLAARALRPAEAPGDPLAPDPPAAGVRPDPPAASATPPRAERARPPAVEEQRGVAKEAATEAVAPLRGTLVLVGEDGVEQLADEAGFALWGEDDRQDAQPGEPLHVEVRAGTFEVALSGRPALRVSGLRVGDRAGVFERDSFAYPDTGLLELRARLLPRSRLRVVDALSGANLQAVRVLQGIPAYRGRVAPGSWSAENVLLEDVASPLTLPARAGIVSYWVGARGYGWSTLRVDHDAGGEREVRLPPAASVEVRVEGPRAGLDLEVRLYPDDEPGFQRTLVTLAPDAAGLAVLEGIPAGSYELRAEVGMWYAPPHVLARAPLELASGDRAQVVLRLDHPLLDTPPAPLAGTLALPAGHASLDVTLRFRPAGSAPLREADRVRLRRADMRATEGEPGLLRFDAGAVTPGLYAAIVDPLQWIELIEVPEGGREDLRLVLPGVHPVEVEVVDAVTGDPVALDRIAWGVNAPPQLRSWSYQNVLPGPRPGHFAWVAPAGRIALVARAPGYGGGNRSLVVEPGGTRTRFELEPLFGASITFLDGEAVVPASWSHSDLALRHAGEQDELERGSGYDLEMANDMRWRVLVSAPGWYVLSFPELPGFVRPEQIELELRAGEVRALEVPLTRAP